MSEKTNDDGEDSSDLEARLTRVLLGHHLEPKKAHSFGLPRPQVVCDGDSSIEEDPE